jgi:hypothetical protein
MELLITGIAFLLYGVALLLGLPAALSAILLGAGLVLLFFVRRGGV